MAFTKRSLRGKFEGRVFLNGNQTTKDEVITLSQLWTEQQCAFFKKMLKQGGNFKVDNSRFKVIPEDKIVNSRGDKDGGIITAPGIDDRF
jgi:hypothetical protein